jgi:hypothetical protein
MPGTPHCPDCLCETLGLLGARCTECEEDHQQMLKTECLCCGRTGLPLHLTLCPDCSTERGWYAD